MKAYTKHSRCLCFVVVAALCSTTSFALSDEELFVRANEQYKKGEFSQAYDLYQQITHKSSSVHYNLGNCSYKMSHFGQALACWRRAEHMWGFWGREELLKNIDMVKRKSTLQQNEPGKEQTIGTALYDFFKSNKTAFVSAARAISLLSLQLIVLFLWVILFFYLRYLYKRKKKFIIVSLFLLQAVFILMLAIKYNTQIREYVVVVNPQATLLSGPGGTFALIQHLPEAQEGVILKESGDYYKVRVNNVIGWIAKSNIEKI